MPINLGSLGQLARPTMAGPGGAMASPRAPMAMPQRPMMAPPQAPVMQRDPGVGRNPGLPMMPQRDPGPGRPMVSRPGAPVMRKRGGPSNLTPQERAILHYWQGGAVHMATGGDPRAAMGRRGDTELAHVNPSEQRLLKTLGGSGTINPKTGLREFYSDSANEHSRADTGHNMSDHSRPGDKTGTGAGTSGGNTSVGGGISPQAQVNRQYQSAPSTSVSGSPSTAKNARQADDEMAAKYGMTPDRYMGAAGELGDKISDANDQGEGTLNSLGKGIASLGGLYEKKPTDSPAALNRAWAESLADANADKRPAADNAADWNGDPFAAAATIAGAVTGLPIGSLYGVATKIFGRPEVGQINLGRNVFGGDSTDTSNLSDAQRAMGGLNGTSSTSAGASHVGGGKGGDGSGQQNVGASPQVISSLGAAAANHPRDPGVGNGADTPPAIDPVTGQEFDPYTGDPLHYGEAGPEHNFWPHGMIPVTSAATGGPISGPGDGQSDDIPAMLSNNEHVVDASTVALAGRGDSKAGHAAIEKWKQDVRRKAGMKNPKKAPLMSIGQLGKAA